MKTMATLEKLYKSLGLGGELGIDPTGVISLSDDGRAWWVRLTADAGAVEGKLHFPEIKASKLFIFAPGFPGGGATDFESQRLQKFLAAGYAVLTIRHNGTILNGPHSDYYISCEPRQKRAKKDQEVLGEKPEYTIVDWLIEPYIAVQALGSAFDEIVVGGHSFGALALLWSLHELTLRKSPHLKKIHRMVSLAGATGRVRIPEDAILMQWHDYLDTDWAKERVNIGEPAVNTLSLEEAYNRIHEPKNVMPEHIQFIFVCAWGDTRFSTDELVTPQEALDIVVTLGRGTIIMDKTQTSDGASGALVHDMSGFKTELFLRLLEKNWKPAKQIMSLDEIGLR
ncbi:MAG: hypothetical protein SGJ27_17340 [Candidatus Melainabacteria bacterium]|nr:hypothetical protein [Candidatus Melainabacteria bacterium]